MNHLLILSTLTKSFAGFASFKFSFKNESVFLVRQFEYEIWQPRNDKYLDSKTQIKDQNPALGSDYSVSGHHDYVQVFNPRDYRDRGYIVAGNEFAEGYSSDGDCDDNDYNEKSLWNTNEPGEDYGLSGNEYGQADGEMENESDTLVFKSDHDPNNMDYNNDRDDKGSKEKETDGGREGGIGGFNHKALSPFLPSFQNYFLKLY